MTQDIAQAPDYREFIRSLKHEIHAAQIKAARSVNTQLIGLYWELGKRIAEKQEAAGWGDAVIGQVAQDLTRELGGLKGFSRANLYRMKKFFNFYLTAVDEEIKTPEDNPSIGLILCRDRDNVVAEYALRDLNKPIGVSRYELSATLPESLKASLPTLEEVEEGLADER